MTDQAADAARADRLSRRRARVLPILVVLLVSQQATFPSAVDGVRSVDHVKIGAWVVMSVVVLLGLATGGGWLRSRGVRALMNDESTRAHRDRACVIGFWAAMTCGVAMYLLAQFVPLGARQAVHLVVTVGIAAALLSFARQERRALR